MDSEYTFGNSYIVDDKGIIYNSLRKLAKCIRVDRHRISSNIKKYGAFKHNGITYYPVKQNSDCINKNLDTKTPCADELEEYTRNKEEFNQWKICKEVEELPFQKYDFKFNDKSKGNRYAIALFSDAHVEETVKPESVLGLNEYNIDIARDRIRHYFANLVSCLNEDKVEDFIFASLGDTISNFLFEEHMETNDMTPIEATMEAQNIIYNGLRYICENAKVNSIKFIGIVGNHGRTTKKIQHSNGYAMSYEYLMYKNIEKICKLNNLPIDFIIPQSEMAIIDMPDKQRFLFAHGFQIKGSNLGTVCGIYPALNRWCMKVGRSLSQNKAFIGHFHSCTSIPNAVVNGSIIGYNSFALTNGFSYEEPAQMYECYDTKNGLLLTRKIYCK